MARRSPGAVGDMTRQRAAGRCPFPDGGAIFSARRDTRGFVVFSIGAPVRIEIAHRRAFNFIAFWTFNVTKNRT